MVVIPKSKGDRTNPNAYRGITLKSHMVKIFEAVLTNRLVMWLESNSKLPREQLAYRKARSGEEHILSLHLLRETVLAGNESLYAGFLDLTKAFPSVNRQMLIKDLVVAGVSSKIISAIRCLYVSDTFQLLLDGVPGSVVFVVIVGVHEGSSLSPVLFIFFIRDLPLELLANSEIDFPRVQGQPLAALIYADDVTNLALSSEGLQASFDTSTSFFERRKLKVNPSKTVCVRFIKARCNHVLSGVWSLDGAVCHEVSEVRYLGVIFDNRGSWASQKTKIDAKAKMALGRVKIMCKTVGVKKLKPIIDLFNSVVGGVIRYGLATWGVQCIGSSILNRHFCDFIKWLFRFPRGVSHEGIMASFARRCTFCDALFLAACGIARANLNPGSILGDQISELVQNSKTSKWFDKVRAELAKRDVAEIVFLNSGMFLSDRRKYGVKFSQFCFHQHLSSLTGSSNDLIKIERPFGIFPFLYSCHPNESRFLLAFLLSCWRWIDSGRCVLFPDVCYVCDQLFSSYHILFECILFRENRKEFCENTGFVFNFEALCVNEYKMSISVVKLGKRMYEKCIEMADLFSDLIPLLHLVPEDVDPRS